MAEAGQEPTVRRPAVGTPRMPPSYGVKRGAGPQSLTWEDMQERLRQARNYWIATTRPDGRPHVMPVWGLWQEDGFYFGTDPASRKGRNLAANPWAVMHLESGDDAVIVEGSVGRLLDTSRLPNLVDAYQAKYQVRPTGLYHLRPRTVFAWQERDFPNTATRWRFSADQ